MRVPCTKCFAGCKNLYEPMTYVAPSGIPGGGLGLFALKNLPQGQWFSDFGPLEPGVKKRLDFEFVVDQMPFSPKLLHEPLGGPRAAFINNVCKDANAAFELVRDIEQYDGLEAHLDDLLQPPQLGRMRPAQCKMRMLVRALKPIAAHTEIFVTYGGPRNFACKCPACQQ